MSTTFLPAGRIVAGVGFLAFLSIACPAAAFHEGRSGSCEGCHGPNRSEGATGAFLLIGSDPSSTCLGCHAYRGAAYTVLSADGSRHTPGGDFYWLGKTFSWTTDGAKEQSPGERHGHNVVAADFALSADGTLSKAPGGSYSAAALGCTSCHNPHGSSAGNFRLLWGVGDGASFRHGAPVARAPANWSETDRNHVAYGSGMSEWCGNCHAGFLDDGSAVGDKKHPAGNDAEFGAAAAANYNAYVKTGDLSGARADAYLALVPFEQGTPDVSGLDPSSTEGPQDGANVMCLTCHRAHASAFEHAGRWDFSATVLADSHPRAGDGGASGGDTYHSYYGRDLVAQFGPYQRSLCAKCHPVD